MAQTLVNLQTTTATGTPDPSLNWTASVTDGLGYLYVLGNTQTLGSQGVDVLLTCYEAVEMTEVWQETYHHTGNTNDYGIDLAYDANGSLVFIAASYDDTLSDYWIVKVNAGDGAVEWQNSWDGGESDVPADVLLDGDGNVYVTGASEVGATSYDVIIWACDANGTEQWYARYDGGQGMKDIGVKLSFYKAGVLQVTGGSSVTGNEWEYAMLTYDISTGNQVAAHTTTSQFPLEKPKAVARDSWGNTYICGAARTGSPAQWDWHVVALDTSYTLIWEVTWDGGDSLDDQALTLVPNDSGGVYVGGYASQGYGREFTVIKIDDQGDVIWDQTLPNPTGKQGVCRQLGMSYTGEVIAAGEIYGSSEGEIAALGYAPHGDVTWYKPHAITVSSGSHPLAMSVTDMGEVWVTGVKLNTQGSQYQSLKYSFFDDTFEVAYDTASNPSHAKGEVILRFDPDALLIDKFLNKDILFGTASSFIASDVIDSMEIKLGLTGQLDNATVVKVFPRILPSDTLSITRLGDTLRIPDFWTTLVLKLPNTAQRTSLDEAVAVDSLSAVKPGIWQAQLNYLYEPDGIAGTNLIPDDPNYASEQLSLHEDPINYPDYVEGDINIEGAWDITTGSSNIRVGIFDHRINWRHEDFDLFDQGGATTRSNSRVIDGWNYFSNQPLFSSVAPYDHGTNCAGIIGASINNGKGISGIAGGDYTTSPINNGVRLYSMEIFKANGNGSSIAKTSGLVNAFIDGVAIRPGGNNFSLDILSNSWSQPSGVNGFSDYQMWSAVDFIFKLGAITVASRGNEMFPDAIQLNFPACYDDDRIINIAGSGINGELATSGNYQVIDINDPESVPAVPFFSKFDGGIDLVAPATTTMVTTTGDVNSSSYRTFSGTSASVPHVVGVAALMLSYISETPAITNTLINEDVENLLQMTASDRGLAQYLTFINNDPETEPTSDYNANTPYIGYDRFTGWGLLDATAALQAIQYPQHIVKHVQTFSNSTPVETQVGSLVTLVISEDLVVPQSLPKGTYKVDIWERAYTINLSSLVPSGYSIESGWGLNAVSNGWENYTTFPLTPMTKVDWGTSDWTTGTITGKSYYYNFREKKNKFGGGWSSINDWYPVNKTDAKLGATIYMSLLSTVTEESEDLSFKVSLYPNPSSSSINLNISELPFQTVSVTIQDLTGKVLVSVDLQIEESGPSEHALLIDNLPAGFYLLTVLAQQGIVTQKFIKN